MPEREREQDSADAQIVMLTLDNGKCPVEEWLNSLRDKTTRARIARQIDKLSRGLGSQRGLAGFAELKINLGPGYRVYHAFLDAKTVIVLLGGGDKSTQSKDIAAARALWEEFQKNNQPEAALRLWRGQADNEARTEENKNT